MRNRFATAATWGIALLVGVSASAQTARPAERPDNKNSETQNRKAGDSDQAQHQSWTIRGELASVSVVGEAMMDYNTGRGVVADLTYLTILGSPSGQDRSQAKDGDSNRDRDNKNSSGDANAGGRRNVYQIAIGPGTQVRDRSKHDGNSSDASAPSTREQSQMAI